ncbi:MAG TPA: hypothetical protein VGD60_12790 [Candidatus Acidoferrales bacterium]
MRVRIGSRLVRGIAVAAALLFISAMPQAQEKKPVASDDTRKPAPGPEMDQLKFLRGYWHYSSVYEKTPFYPNGGKGGGTYITSEGPGGFSQIAEFQGTSPEGREVGHEVTTWEPKENAYKSYIFGNSFPGCVVRTGHWDGNTLIFDAEFDFNGEKLHIESATTATSEGTITIVEKAAHGDDPLQTTVTLKATREQL